MIAHISVLTSHETHDGSDITIRWSVVEGHQQTFFEPGCPAEADFREATVFYADGSLRALTSEEVLSMTGKTWPELEAAAFEELNAQAYERESHLQ